MQQCPPAVYTASPQDRTVELGDRESGCVLAFTRREDGAMIIDIYAPTGTVIVRSAEGVRVQGVGR